MKKSMTIHEIPRNSTKWSANVSFFHLCWDWWTFSRCSPGFCEDLDRWRNFLRCLSGVKTLPKNKAGNGNWPFLIGEYIFKCFFPIVISVFRGVRLTSTCRCVSFLDEHVVGETNDRNRSDRVADCFEVWGPWGVRSHPRIPLIFGLDFEGIPIILATNVSPTKAFLKMSFLFPRWDMLVPYRVS